MTLGFDHIFNDPTEFREYPNTASGDIRGLIPH